MVIRTISIMVLDTSLEEEGEGREGRGGEGERRGGRVKRKGGKRDEKTESNTSI